MPEISQMMFFFLGCEGAGDAAKKRKTTFWFLTLNLINGKHISGGSIDACRRAV